MTDKQDEWIEKWLLNRLGKGNRFEQFNCQFCKDLVNDYKPIIEEQERERIYKGVITVTSLTKEYIEIRMKLDIWQGLKGNK